MSACRTDAHCFSCHAHVTDHQTHMRSAQGYGLFVSTCSSKVTHSSHVSRYITRVTILVAQSVLIILLLIFSYTDTRHDKPSISAESFDESKTLCHSARRHAVWPSDRTKPSHRTSSEGLKRSRITSRRVTMRASSPPRSEQLLSHQKPPDFQRCSTRDPRLRQWLRRPETGNPGPSEAKHQGLIDKFCSVISETPSPSSHAATDHHK